jgi:hypothetical protein
MIWSLQTPWWWRDAIVLAQIQAAGTVVGAALATFAIVYAWRVARKQFSVMDDQTAIGKRQMELAEKQDRIIQEQISRRTDLKFVMYEYEWDQDCVSFGFRIENAGNKTSNIFHWEFLMLIDSDKEDLVEMSDDCNNHIAREYIEKQVRGERDAWSFRTTTGNSRQQLFPGETVKIVNLKTTAEWISTSATKRLDVVNVFWRIRSDDGQVPATGYGHAHLLFAGGQEYPFKELASEQLD